MPSVRAPWSGKPCAPNRGARGDKGLPDLSENLAGDCANARSTPLNNRCAIYYPQLPALFLTDKER